MTRNTTSRPAVHALLRIASRQFGLFTTADAMHCGLTRHQLRTLVSQGIVERRRPGLYRVSGAALSPEQRIMEGVLAAPGAVASHESAGFVLGLIPAPSQVHVTVAPTRRLRLDGVTAHRSPVPKSHRAHVGPFPVTSLARTVVDLATMSDLDRLAEIMDPLLVDGRLTPRRLVRVIDEIVDAPGRNGTALLKAALDVWAKPIKPGSPAEVRLLRRLTEHGYDGFVTQQRVTVEGSTYFLDVAWPEELVSLEYTGKLHHGPRRWANDERRTADIESVGWRSREVDVADLAPGSTSLWTWLAKKFISRAA